MRTNEIGKLSRKACDTHSAREQSVSFEGTTTQECVEDTLGCNRIFYFFSMVMGGI